MRFPNENPLSFEKPKVQPVADDDCGCDDGGVIVCSNCAEPVDPETMFCHICGKRLK